MYTRQHIQKKAPSSSSSTPVPTSIFGQRPFKNETDSAVPPQQQETPDLQTQLEKATRFGHNFGRVQVGDTPAVIQPKLAIGAPGDKYEQEADQMAAQVMSMAAPANQQSVQREMAPEEEKEKLQTKPLAASITPVVQREMAPKPEEEEQPVQAKPLAGLTIQREMAPKPEEEEQPVQAKPLAGFTIQREMAPKPEEEEQPVQAKPLAGFTIQREMAPKPEEEEQPVQTKPSLQRATEAGGNDAGSNLENRLSSSKGGGIPLSDEVRSFMEPRFGADFSQVRVHTDSQAVQMNKDLGAQAFTNGSDIYFGAGKSPTISDLTAHELTHVVQQTGAVQPKLTADQREKQHEQKTELAADKATPRLQTKPATLSPVQQGTSVIQRDNPPATAAPPQRYNPPPELATGRMPADAQIVDLDTRPLFNAINGAAWPRQAHQDPAWRGWAQLRNFTSLDNVISNLANFTNGGGLELALAPQIGSVQDLHSRIVVQGTISNVSFETADGVKINQSAASSVGTTAEGSSESSHELSATGGYGKESGGSGEGSGGVTRSSSIGGGVSTGGGVTRGTEAAEGVRFSFQINWNVTIYQELDVGPYATAFSLGIGNLVAYAIEHPVQNVSATSTGVVRFPSVRCTRG